MDEVKKMLQELGETFEAYKATNDQRIDEIRASGQANAITEERMAKLDAAIDDLKTRIKEAEASAAMPARSGQGEPQSKEEREHFDAFLAYVRNPKDQQALARMQAAQRAAGPRMEVSVGTPAAGGYALPEVIERQIASKIVDLSPMRSIVTVRQSSTTDYKELVNVHGGGYEWVGEGDTRNASATPQIAEVAPTFGTIQSYMPATEESLNDLFFNVEQFIIDESALQHAKGEGIAIISGNGTSKPTGFLNGSPVTTDDEELVGSPPAGRAFGTLQYLPTGNASGFGVLSTTSPVHYPGDVLLDTVYALKAGYRSNARWVGNKSTLAVLRKLKDADGNYLWSPGLAMGQPDTLVGYAFTEAEDMPDIGANAFPLAFGDFAAGYVLVDLVGTRITIDPYTTPGKVKFYVRRRVGGKVRNDDAIKLVKCAAS